jgi:hypothetical protein
MPYVGSVPWLPSGKDEANQPIMTTRIQPGYQIGYDPARRAVWMQDGEGHALHWNNQGRKRLVQFIRSPEDWRDFVSVVSDIFGIPARPVCPAEETDATYPAFVFMETDFAAPEMDQARQ